MTSAARNRMPWRIRRAQLGRQQAPSSEPLPRRRAQWTYYHDNRIHRLCPTEHQADEPVCLCATCRTCELCLRRALHRDGQYWYRSRAEANTAWRLDLQLRRGEIAAWSRSARVVLQDGPASVRVTYQPDFDITALDGSTRRLEVKGAGCRCARCRPHPPGARKRQWQPFEDDALLKIKLYRGQAAEHGWPPLFVVDAEGREIHV